MNDFAIYVLIFAGILGIFLGTFTGLIIRDFRLRNGLEIVINAFCRVTKKKWRRARNPDIDMATIQRDQVYIALPYDKRFGSADTKAIRAVTELKQRLCSKFENQIDAVYLFGSRARGDHQTDSDVDVAIYFASPYADLDHYKKEIVGQTGKLLLEYGLYIQPRIFESVEKTSSNCLNQAVVGYGILVQ